MYFFTWILNGNTYTSWRLSIVFLFQSAFNYPCQPALLAYFSQSQLLPFWNIKKNKLFVTPNHVCVHSIHQIKQNPKDHRPPRFNFLDNPELFHSQPSNKNWQTLRKDTRVGNALHRRKLLVFEVEYWAYSVALCMCTMYRFH